MTLEDKVIYYKGRQILVQTNEYDADADTGSRVKSVAVTELLEPLYASTNPTSDGSKTRARGIRSPEDRKELTEMIRKLGIDEPINFV